MVGLEALRTLKLACMNLQLADSQVEQSPRRSTAS
jgi:hypothetical protein